MDYATYINDCTLDTKIDTKLQNYPFTLLEKKYLENGCRIIL